MGVSKAPALKGTVLPVPDRVRVPVAQRIVGFFTEGKASIIAISQVTGG